jgi:hypothetical protein
VSMPIVVGARENPFHIRVTYFNYLPEKMESMSYSSRNNIFRATADSFVTLDTYHRRCKIFYTQRKGSRDEDLVFDESLVTW